MASTRQFEKGENVRLKGGGQTMTVISSSEHLAVCRDANGLFPYRHDELEAVEVQQGQQARPPEIDNVA